MATHSTREPPRPLLDPDQFEQAGRFVRQWLGRLAVQAPVKLAKDDIAWEDGEPRAEIRSDPANR